MAFICYQGFPRGHVRPALAPGAPSFIMFKLSNLEQHSKAAQFTDIPFQDLTETSNYGLRPRDGPVLNQDIIYTVMEAAYYNSLLLPDSKQLSRYALVARAWRKPAQWLLFHEVTVREDVAYKSLLSLFEGKQSEHAQWLASCVRVLNFWISRTGKVSAATWECRLPIAIKWFPQLYELRLGADLQQRLADSTMVLLNSTPPIRALQIAMRTDEKGTRPTKSVLPFQILTVKAWKLEFLVMRGEVFNSAGHVDFPPVTHQLVEFRWTVPTAATDSLVEGLITYVTANSLKTLEVLHVPSGTHPVVTKVAPTLRSLKVTSSTGIPKRLNHLKELIVADPLFHYLDTLLYATLPPNLTHLGVLSNVFASQGQFQELTYNLPSKLELFSLYFEPQRHLSGSPTGMEIFALGNGIQVRVFAGKELAQVGMRSDLVKSTVYPRGVSVENMRSMGRLGSSDDVPITRVVHPQTSMIARLKIPFVSKPIWKT